MIKYKVNWINKKELIIKKLKYIINKIVKIKMR